MSWITGHLTGGLGNRLFQHAAAAGLAEQWNYPLVFYTGECEPTNHGPFENIFKLFPSVPVVTATVPVTRLPEPNGGVFTFTAFPQHPVAPFVSVDGWRQTEKYFPRKGIQPDFESALSKDRCRQLQQQYSLETVEQRKKTAFVHFRLGDYKILPHHQINIQDYYSKAIDFLPKDYRILLFSDESQQFGNVLQSFLEHLGRGVEIVKNEDELESLYIMSQCWGGAIVANSTFSWWGAYFARQPEGFLAIYPGKWGNGLPEAKDIVPSWGIRVANE